MNFIASDYWEVNFGPNCNSLIRFIISLVWNAVETGHKRNQMRLKPVLSNQRHSSPLSIPSFLF